MATQMLVERVAIEEIAASSAFRLLGGANTLNRTMVSPLDVHDLLIQGISSKALTYLVKQVGFLSSDELLSKAIGISLRTLQRHRANESDHLSPEQSSRAWRFAKLLAKASTVLGSQQAAEEWMLAPAYGLENRKPIDLLASSEGADLVDEHLTRMEYGIYS